MEAHSILSKSAVAYGQRFLLVLHELREVEQAVDEVIEMVGLQNFRKHYPNQLSASMLQRVVIARAFATKPELLLMDEPFVGLDPRASHQLKVLMRQFCDGGGAIFFSTHVLEVAEKLCDKVAIIRGGRLVRAGAMDEVRGDDSLEEVFLELEGEKDDA